MRGSFDDSTAYVRHRIDRVIGTTTLAIVVRTLLALALFGFALAPRDRGSFTADLRWGAEWAGGLIVLPALRDLERVFGARLLTGLILFVVLGVPLLIAAMFSLLAATPRDGSFRNAEVYWSLKAAFGLIALGAWIVFGLALRKTIPTFRNRKIE